LPGAGTVRHVDAVDYLKLLLDADRLAVVGLVALGPATADELAERAGLTRRDVLETLAPLVRGGIVVADAERYHLDRAALRDLAGDLPAPAGPAEAVFFGMTEEEGEVLARFFRGERLTEIPAHRAKRLVVLERLALEFEPGVRYDEREVNEKLAVFHPDHASLRRYLVDEGFLDREDGEYWRAGGRVATAATRGRDAGHPLRPSCARTNRGGTRSVSQIPPGSSWKVAPSRAIASAATARTTGRPWRAPIRRAAATVAERCTFWRPIGAMPSASTRCAVRAAVPW
jgi:hypothetical protein